MPKAGTQLHQAATDIERCAAIYESRKDTLDLLADPRRSSDLEAIRSGISDPTPAQAMTLQQWHELQEALFVAYTEAVNAPKILWQILSRIPSSFDAQAAARAALCVDPTCEEFAVKAGWCAKHYMREYRASKTG